MVIDKNKKINLQHKLILDSEILKTYIAERVDRTIRSDSEVLQADKASPCNKQKLSDGELS